MEELEQLLHRTFVPLGNDPNRPIGMIGHPPREVQSTGFDEGTLSKKDTLDASEYRCFQANRSL